MKKLFKEFKEALDMPKPIRNPQPFETLCTWIIAALVIAAVVCFL